MHSRFLQLSRAALRVVILAAVTGVFARSAAGYTPESPEVKDSVAKALKFLESEKGDDIRLGAKALIALTFVKCGAKPDHPRIVEAVEAIRKKLGDRDPAKLQLGRTAIYHAGLVVMFLVAHDRDTHQADIECVLKYLQLVQKDHGGWGYPDWKTGDTSMTQYGVLCSWEAIQAGFRVPDTTINKMASWLLRTQNPEGGFAYQGKASSSFARIPQDAPTVAMSTAGLGSLYICSDLLGLTTEIEPPDEDVPPALQKVREKPPLNSATPTRGPNLQLFAEAEGLAMSWLGKNYKPEPPARYSHYYLYALERCMSFRELWQNKVQKNASADGPIWYNHGVEFLRRTQAEDGSWSSTSKKPAGTAFAVLFLIRSTQKSIRKSRIFGGGTLVGGRGLPKETDRVRVRDGKVEVEPLVSVADELLAVLENTETPDFSRAADLVAALPPDEAEKVLQKHVQKLRSLAENESPAARMAAVRALSKTGDLDNVPTLIYALTDPDPQIVIAARNGLRRISRNPAGLGLADKPSESGLRLAAARWKAWYLAIRPDAELAD